VRIAIDIRAAASEQVSGKGVWTRECARALFALAGPRHRFLLLTNRMPLFAVPQNADVTQLPAGPGWHMAAWRLLRSERPDVYLSPSSYILPALGALPVPCVSVIHDLAVFLPGAHDRKARIIERLLLGRTLRRAAAILCVSQATARDLQERFPNTPDESIRICHAGPGCDSPPLNRPDGRTILCIGTLSPRKNQLRLIRAFERLPEEIRGRYRLVLVGGRGWHDDAIVVAAQTVPGVEWRGYVTDKEQEALLSEATVFAYPSLAEGFGLPLLDALQRGIPVLTSDRSSLAEVAGEAALLVDPEDTEAIASGLERLCSDDALRARLREEGPRRAAQFSWEKTARIVLDVLEKTAA
jgi:glycosyltransferase involved in cell wall biosynthesis